MSISKSTPTLAQELTIYGWEGYMPQAVLDAFSAEYAVAINYVAYGDPLAVTEGLRQGAVYDVVILDNVEIQNLAQENLLAELDHRNLSNFSHIANDFRDLAFDPQNKYSVPFEWGTSGLLYRTDLVEQPLTHWADLWNPANTGKIALWPYPSDVIGLTLKSLGYSYNSQNAEELAQAGERLMELKDRVFIMDSLDASGVPHLVSGEAHIIFGWAYDMQAAEDENVDNITYVLPEEGTIIWMDNLAIPASSSDKYTAELFLDFIMRPEVSAQIANEMYVAMPNQGARQFIEPEVLNNALIFPTAEHLANGEFYAAISPEVQKLHDEIWSRFIAEIP